MRSAGLLLALLAACGEDSSSSSPAPGVASIVEVDLAAFRVAADLDGDGVGESLAAAADGIVVDDGALLPLPNTREVRAGDLDGDGRDDLAASADGGIHVLMAPALEPMKIATPRAFTVGDADGDGDLEVVLGGMNQYSVYDGSTQTLTTYHFPTDPAVAFEISGIAVMDGSRIALGLGERIRIVEPDGSYADVVSPAVAALEAWNGGLVVVDADGGAWHFADGIFTRLAFSGIGSARVVGSTLHLLRGSLPAVSAPAGW